MQKFNISIAKETPEEQSAARRHNPSLVAQWTFPNRPSGKFHRFHLGSGYGDIIQCYRDREIVYVLSSNPYMGYVGLQAYSMATMQEIGDVFMQSQDDIDHALGPKGLELSAPTIIRRLSQYFGD